VALVKNLTIVGNCLGLGDDLLHAVADFDAGRFSAVTDSEFGGSQTAEFLDRTFNDRRRFGKVIFRYDPT
jgi:hypothetical protein